MGERARIFKPAKTAMQSGKRNTKKWILEYEPSEARKIDPLMGWTGSGDTQRQVRLRFDTKDEAVAYAEKHGLDYQVTEPKPHKPHLRAYADNFKYGRKGLWTH